jgi:alginate O-acetyltransferase complex protein AlgI
VVFSSFVFVSLFLPIVFLVNHKLPSRVSNAVLIVFSLLLYAWGEPVYVALLVAAILANYGIALFIHARPRLGTALALLLNLGLLYGCKYLSFTLETISALTGRSFSVHIHMPIGVSFYTFQAMSYVFDVKRGVCRPQRSLSKLMLYIALFPQLIAGPIVKYSDIESYLDDRHASAEEIARGFRRFCVGLAKKVLVANVLAKAADAAFALAPGDMSVAIAWLGAAAYALQIYYDFSGYSDMAIGIGLALGFRFRENFAHPYAASSMRGFWRRWHISLSLWFREYVYIPLGGNRRGPLRTAANRLIVFLLTGLWHGANWTFLVWGLGNGILVAIEGLIAPDERSRPLRGVGRLYVIVACICLFVVFRADSLGHAAAYLARMWTWPAGATDAERVLIAGLFDGHMILTMAMATVCAGNRAGTLRRGFAAMGAGRFFEPCAYLCSLGLLLLSFFALASQTYNPFIYFRF